MKYFTKAQIEEIRKQLATLGVRDTDLPPVTEMSGEELVAIVQDGVNKKVGISRLLREFLPEDIADRIADGESAYEIAVRHGYTGTEEQWLESLKGETGSTGAKGEKGDTGAKGDKGDKGEKGDPGSGSEYTLPVATANELGGIKIGYTGSAEKTYGVQLDAQNRAFVSVPWESGSGGGGEGSGSDGRSVTRIDMWFKLSASSNESAPDLSIADPSSYAGGRWTLTSDNPTAELPYLWAFMQVNYDKALSTGYTYSRSGAYIARRYNADSSSEYSDLEAMIQSLRSDMESDMAGYEDDLSILNTSLNSLRTTIEGSITSDINTMKARFASINGTDVKKIEDSGLWGVMTSYQDDTNGQKSFSDIVLDAKNAKNTLTVGSQFFGNRTSAEVNLDGLKGEIALKATKDYVDSSISSAQFSVDPAALKSVIAKGQKAWKDGDNVLYPYNHHLDDGTFTPDPDSSDGELVQYEAYMVKTAAQGGPSDGPFTLVTVVTQFSTIQQTVDEISSSVDTYRYMWDLNDAIYSYDYFESDYETYSQTHSGITYEQYVTTVRRATKVEVSNVLSNFSQSSNEIRSTIGDMGYMWRKQNQDGTYSYQRYAVPSNKTRDTYVSEMQSAGWSLYDYSTKMTVIDQTADDITLAVKKSRLVWINSSLAATNPLYCVDYEYWYDDYESSSYSGTYEQFVGANHSQYTLTALSSGMSRIKQAENSISSTVSDVSALGTRMSAVEQTAEEISAGVGKTYKAWKNAAEDLVEYSGFESEWESSGSSFGYEAWVQSVKSYSLVEVTTELSGIKIKSDKIWAGVNDGNGNVAAAISILSGAGTSGGKIVLDASTVEVNAALSASIISANAARIKELAAEQIDATEISTNKLLTTGASGTLNILAQNGLLGIYLGAIDESNLATNRRAAFGIENGDVVLKFYDASGNEMYNLGPSGITQLGFGVTMPTIEALQFYYTSSKIAVGTEFNGRDYQQVYLYHYIDGTRVTNVGATSGGLEFWNPVTNRYSSSHSPYHDGYYLDLTHFEEPSSGFYISETWQSVSIPSGAERAIMFDYTGSERFDGYVVFNNIDHTGRGYVYTWYGRDEK